MIFILFKNTPNNFSKKNYYVQFIIIRRNKYCLNFYSFISFSPTYNKYKRKWVKKGAKQRRAMAPYLTVGILPAKFGFSFNKSLIQNPNPLLHTSKLKFKSNLGFKSSLKCRCIKKETTDKPTEVCIIYSKPVYHDIFLH